MASKAQAFQLIRLLSTTVGFTSAICLSACDDQASAVTPEAIERQYGVSGAYSDTVVTPENAMKSTVIPVTLADGRKAQLVVPQEMHNEPHALYVRDDDGLHPVHLHENARRDEVIRSPRIAERRPEPSHQGKHSWERDALIIGGGAGAGTAIGALAGGKTGAGVGAAVGGVGGLIYDLATRDKNKK